MRVRFFDRETYIFNLTFPNVLKCIILYSAQHIASEAK